jgi:hypothetical protein
MGRRHGTCTVEFEAVSQSMASFAPRHRTGPELVCDRGAQVI